MPPTQNQPPIGTPSSLPPLAQPANTQGAIEPSTQPAQAPAAVPAAAAHAAHNLPIAAQAKALVAQYKSDPYRLSMALQQLKRKYLSEHFGIHPEEEHK